MSTKTVSKKEPTSMAELLASASSSVKGFKMGDKIKGKVTAIYPKSLVLDIGGKSEGIVAEKAFQEARDLIRGLKVGDEITAMVLVPETREGTVVLSLREAATGAVWDKLEDEKKAGREVTVMGRNASASGVTVELEGKIGFIPASQLGHDAISDMEGLVGEHFKAKIIELDKNSNKIILSEKEVSEAGEIKSNKEALSKVKEGEIYEGTVVTVTNFGCFVRLSIKGKEGSDVEGLVHISEISWEKIDKVSDVLKEGDKVKVKVIGVRDGRLSLSIKHAKKDPWDEAIEKYKPETKFTGKVTKVSDFGVFVQIEPGLEGLIHITKIPPATKLHTGDEIKCNIEEINIPEKKISLGLVLTSKPVGYK